MSDDSVRAALRSDARLVVIEAPAGCGKTHQGAEYVREIAQATPGSRPLILTHTHAACSVFAERTRGGRACVDVRTIDSVIVQIASAYHAGLGLPADVTGWTRQRDDGYAKLAIKVAALVKRHPMIASSLAKRHSVVICDEHQDSSGDQHAVVMALLAEGANLRLFADPMQRIFGKSITGATPSYEWDELKRTADRCEELDVPHRWENGCAALGAWTLEARRTLKQGGKIDLRTGLPPGVSVVFAENRSQRNLEYQLANNDRKPIDAFEAAESSLLILTRHNQTARSFRGFFNRRVALWEGHTRYGLEKLVDAVNSAQGDPNVLAEAIVDFMASVGKGFSPSAFGNAFKQEVRAGCAASRKGKPAAIQELARCLIGEPNHCGVAQTLRRLSELKETHEAFNQIEIDYRREFQDAVRLGEFEVLDEGFAEITTRRTHARPKPPAKAISTIHKAKGLECDSVIVMPCDATTFPNKPDARCLLYVALSRARSRLLLVASRSEPSPLFIV